MNLLFINRFFYPDQSATAQLLTDLAVELASRGFGVTVVTGRAGYLQEKPLGPQRKTYKGVVVTRVWSTRFGRRSTIGRVIDYVSFYLCAAWAAARTERIECLIVLSDPPMLSVLAALLGRLRRWKTVCWLQDVFPENAVQAGLIRDGWMARLLIRIAHRSVNYSSRVIVVGRCMKQRLLDAGISCQRIVYIPNWADGRSLIPVVTEENWFRTQHGLDGRFVVMYSGNLGMVHDAESLLGVIRALREFPDICFVFMGYGQGKARLEKQARREGFAHLRFIDYQAQQHLRYTLSAGDLHLVSLRTDMEGLSVPSKIYGIMAVGRPVMFIGPEGSEVASVVREAGCGEVFDPTGCEKAALAIRHLAGDPERRAYLGAAGRRYFETVLEKRFAIDRFESAFRSMGL
jgi:colanic acid biosynthesis glycosyl transferase WcaI